jgi:hypothetical protein
VTSWRTVDIVQSLDVDKYYPIWNCCAVSHLRRSKLILCCEEGLQKGVEGWITHPLNEFEGWVKAILFRLLLIFQPPLFLLLKCLPFLLSPPLCSCTILDYPCATWCVFCHNLMQFSSEGTGVCKWMLVSGVPKVLTKLEDRFCRGGRHMRNW